VDFPRNSGMIAASEEETMSRRPRRNHIPAFKAKVAVEAIKGEKTMIGLSQAYDVHPNQVKQCCDQLLEDATGIFGDTGKADAEPVDNVKELHAEIGQLPLENDFCPERSSRWVCWRVQRNDRSWL
jgi:transposase